MPKWDATDNHMTEPEGNGSRDHYQFDETRADDERAQKPLTVTEQYILDLKRENERLNKLLKEIWQGLDKMEDTIHEYQQIK